jgi:hypothetical protein
MHWTRDFASLSLEHHRPAPVMRDVRAMEKKDVLIQALRATEGLPTVLRERTDKVEVCEDELFDESYIRDAEEAAQTLKSSDPERAKLLEKWKALRPFCDVTLLQGAIWTEDSAFNFWVDPRTRGVLHFYEWGKEKFKLGKQLIDLRNQYEAFKHKSKAD